ncbi:hypothetical protein B0H10DRAFT_1957822 [Mycena sp. CBHHK59/15]|nr:hypothetical protein B0H10DRAFT_1957822 [Mycena sp. CBHHK59/15]
MSSNSHMGAEMEDSVEFGDGVKGGCDRIRREKQMRTLGRRDEEEQGDGRGQGECVDEKAGSGESRWPVHRVHPGRRSACHTVGIPYRTWRGERELSEGEKDERHCEAVEDGRWNQVGGLSLHQSEDRKYGVRGGKMKKKEEKRRDREDSGADADKKLLMDGQEEAAQPSSIQFNVPAVIVFTLQVVFQILKIFDVFDFALNLPDCENFHPRPRPNTQDQDIPKTSHKNQIRAPQDKERERCVPKPKDLKDKFIRPGNGPKPCRQFFFATTLRDAPRHVEMRLGWERLGLPVELAGGRRQVRVIVVSMLLKMNPEFYMGVAKERGLRQRAKR